VKSAETSILAVHWQQAANPTTEAALCGITRTLESEGRAFICLFTIHNASRLLDRSLRARGFSASVYVALFSYSPVTYFAPAMGGWFDAQTMTLRIASTGRGTINFCADCHNNKASVWSYGTAGGQGINPSVSGTNATTWTNTFDLTLAKKLNTTFGPGRIWWNTPR